MLKNAIYHGLVYHKRFLPRVHELKYAVFQILFDIENEISNSKLISRNKFNLFGLYDKDHGPNQSKTQAPLGMRMREFLRHSNFDDDGCRIFLMAMPRILGFVFNPISVYFVEDNNEQIKAIIYEVNNTFGDRHTYLISDDKAVCKCHSAKKMLHVSPFMQTSEMQYDFETHIKEDLFYLHILLSKLKDNGKDKFLFASFNAKSKSLNDKNLFFLFLKLPLMTLKVVFAIHWEAVKLLAKGIQLKPKPPTEKSSHSLIDK